MRRPFLAGAGLVLALACSDDPAAPRRIAPAETAPAAHATTAPCTTHWRLAANGNWSDPGNWKPFGVPGATDVACIDIAGTYTVTVDGTNPVVGTVVAGGTGVSATLRIASPTGPGIWTIRDELRIEKGSTISIRQGAVVDVTGGLFTLVGALRTTITGTGVAVYADSMVLPGDITCDGLLLMLHTATGAIRSSGNLTANSPCRIDLIPADPGLVLEGGALGGDGAIGAYGSVHWKGGSLPAHPTTGAAPLTLFGDTLFLEAPTLSGTIELRADTTWHEEAAVIGDVASGVQLRVATGPSGAAPAAVRLAGATGGALTNLGSLTLDAPSHLLTVTGPGVVNAGTMTITGASGVRLAHDSTVNQGALSLLGPGEWTGVTGLLRNRGTIGSTGTGALALNAATFVAEAGSVVTGPMTATGSTVTGTGTLGNVTATGARIQPGAPVGTLTAASLVLDAASSVTIEVAGATTHDRLDVLGAITYGGTLAVQEVAPFQSAACGQVLPVITDHATGSRGAFGKFTGLSPALTRSWRVYNPAGVLDLVGHNPLVPVSASPMTLTVAEGGPAAAYAVCLRSAPGANVTVTPTATLGQLVAMPALVFTPTSWALPLLVGVTAINDVLYEPPPQADAVAHTITSTAPPYNTAALGQVAVTIVDNDGSANLELNVLNAPPVVAAGGTFTLSLREQNLGPDTSPGATITIPASAGYSYLSSTGVPGCSSDPVTGTTCQLASLANGTTQSFTISFTALAPGSYSTTYTLSSIQFDSNLGNNSRVQVITVN